MKYFSGGLLLIISLIATVVSHAQTYNFPTVYSPASCTYTYEITITVRLDSIGITNIYFDDGTTGSFAFEAYVSYDNSIVNSTLPAGNFYTYDITVYSDNPNLSSSSLTNNANSVPLVTSAVGGIASQNNPTYIGSASALGLSQGQYYSSPSLLAQLGYDSATIHINLPCMDTVVQADSVIPLPILWSKLSATNNGNFINLSWQTFTEQNNDGFQIERSTDAIDWNVIAFTQSKAIHGVSNVAISYNFETREILPGIYYHRIIQKDRNGKSLQSNVVKTVIDAVSNSVCAYPNPAKDELYLSGIPDKAAFNIYDLFGRSILKGYYDKKIDIRKLSSGIYWLNCAGSNIKIAINNN